MTTTTERHAEAILRASGSSLRNYTMPAVRDAILAAVLACYEEGCRDGVVLGAAYASGEDAAA
jgi:hypothetical protein